jgi:hypothetical protein
MPYEPKMAPNDYCSPCDWKTAWEGTITVVVNKQKSKIQQQEIEQQPEPPKVVKNQPRKIRW